MSVIGQMRLIAALQKFEPRTDVEARIRTHILAMWRKTRTLDPRSQSWILLSLPMPCSVGGCDRMGVYRIGTDAYCDRPAHRVIAKRQAGAVQSRRTLANAAAYDANKSIQDGLGALRGQTAEELMEAMLAAARRGA